MCSIIIIIIIKVSFEEAVKACTVRKMRLFSTIGDEEATCTEFEKKKIADQNHMLFLQNDGGKTF